MAQYFYGQFEICLFFMLTITMFHFNMFLYSSGLVQTSPGTWSTSSTVHFPWRAGCGRTSPGSWTSCWHATRRRPTAARKWSSASATRPRRTTAASASSTSDPSWWNAASRWTTATTRGNRASFWNSTTSPTGYRNRTLPGSSRTTSRSLTGVQSTTWCTWTARAIRWSTRRTWAASSTLRTEDSPPSTSPTGDSRSTWVLWLGSGSPSRPSESRYQSLASCGRRTLTTRTRPFPVDRYRSTCWWTEYIPPIDPSKPAGKNNQLFFCPIRSEDRLKATLLSNSSFPFLNECEKVHPAICYVCQTSVKRSAQLMKINCVCFVYPCLMLCEKNMKEPKEM